MVKVDAMLRTIIVVCAYFAVILFSADKQSLFEADSKALLSPITWRHHQSTLEAVLLYKKSDSDGNPAPAQPSHSSLLDRERSVEDVKRRSQALAFAPTETASTTSPRRLQMEDYHKLDGMNGDTNMIDLCRTYFDGTASPMNVNVNIARLEEKTFVLLSWAMGMFDLGVHRAYAVGSLLSHWNDQHSRTLKKAGQAGKVDMYHVLYKWLDTSEVAQKEDNLFAIGIIFGELTRQGLFSFSRYFQTLIAHGHTARSRAPGQTPSHHLALFSVMPVFVEAPHLTLQRRLAICGDDEEAAKAMDAEEERLMEDFKEAVKEYVPEMFGWSEFACVERGDGADGRTIRS